MTDGVARYYTDELNGWDAALAFYEKEILQIQVKLVEIIRLNTIASRAMKAEEYLEDFNHAHANLNAVSKEIFQQGSEIQRRDNGSNVTVITEEISKQQDLIRDKMKQVEERFVALKYKCQNFLAQSFNQ